MPNEIFTAICEEEETKKCRGDGQRKALGTEGKVERDEGRTTGALTGQKVCFLHLLCLLSM